MADSLPHFDINASVVFRLGEELITDEVQALVELVKNSYDADASWVKVTIDTQVTRQKKERYPGAQGLIQVEDDGSGMSRVTIEKCWLTIANSPKGAQKANGVVTEKGRTPIGDKGLGRLGVQRLADNVEIITRQRGNFDEHYVAFSWKDFRDKEKLSDVTAVLEPRGRTSSTQGTKLILTGLREPETWRGERNIQELQRKLSGMISPFQEARDFIVYLELDGKRLELAEIAQQLRDAALLHYRFDFDGTTFSVTGKARLDFLQPAEKDDRALLSSLCRRDGGLALFDFLAKTGRRKRPPRFSRSNSASWFVEFGRERKLEELDKVRRTGGNVANPGPFRGEVDVVSLGPDDSRPHAFDRKSDYRRLVRDLAGVRVYRDGFGVRVGEDWLGLGKQWTSATSYYGLRPGNVLGYVALTARDNAALTETTSREGFQGTPHYENLYALLTDFVRFAGDAQEFLRRGTLDFLNEHKDRTAGFDPLDSPGDVTRRIDSVVSSLEDKRKKLKGHPGRLQAVAEKATATLELLDEVDAELAKASELKSLREVLDRRWNSLQGELGALFESISLGLTAEALSHEIHNIADGLAKRSAALLRQLQSGEVRKATIVAYVEHVRSSVAGMRKQLAHLAPSLKYLREQREPIDLTAFLKELATFHNDRLEAKAITVEVLASTKATPRLSINKGKLTQVFDNLIINSDYWLCEAIRTDYIKSGVITLTIEGPVVRVADNGRGIDPAVEETLFDPFMTMKERREGRGLGLFVVQQLLDSEACTAVLLPERNAFGRRYIFELDFTGALCE